MLLTVTKLVTCWLDQHMTWSVKVCRLLGKTYGVFSSRVSAVGDFGEVMASVREAVLAQDKLSRDISPVPCSTLISHHCQVWVSVCLSLCVCVCPCVCPCVCVSLQRHAQLSSPPPPPPPPSPLQNLLINKPLQLCMYVHGCRLLRWPSGGAVR